MKILHIDASPSGENSTSRRFSAEVVKRLTAANPGATVVRRDLIADQLPHIDPGLLGAFFTPADKLTAEQTRTLSTSDRLTDELLAADAVVIGTPMHNFSVPSALKAWIDHVVRVGKTFHYTAQGPAGLVPAGKKVYLVVSRGGVYSAGPFAAYEHQDTYLKHILGFLGLTDVSTVQAEGMNLGPEMAAKGAAEAEAAVAKIAA